ncbi:hypothetical protein V6N11_024453 [Hibiscus sabdariffa]|uniref:Uncharacterized protein n=1 Tax=Hibiscus sabdariffa TaxID=183260 RepID=A0ABR2QM60_9ROSI
MCCHSLMMVVASRYHATSKILAMGMDVEALLSNNPLHSALPIIIEFGDCIGPILKLDYQTEGGPRGRFTRMTISLEPVVSKLVINGCVQIVVDHLYGSKYGPVQDIYPFIAPEAHPVQSAPPQVHIVDPSESNFGPWMVVDRRQRRTPPKSNSSSTISKQQAPHMALVLTPSLIIMKKILRTLWLPRVKRSNDINLIVFVPLDFPLVCAIATLCNTMLLPSKGKLLVDVSLSRRTLIKVGLH